MKLMSVLRPTNRRVRVLVGLVLAALLAVQCTRTEAWKADTGVVAIGGSAMGANPPELLVRMEKLAKTDHIALLQMCLENYQSKYRDYTCTFTKQEVINGQAKPRQEMEAKFLGKPFSVLLTWTKNAPIGDRVLYVEGKYGNNMLVRPTNGFLRAISPTFVRAPDDVEAMKNTLRPVNRFGFERSLKSLLEIYTAAKKNGELKESFGGFASVDGRKCIVLIRHLPNKPEYQLAAEKTIIFIDAEYLVPIRVEGFDWQEKPSSLYQFTNLAFNVGLTEADFAPEKNDLVAPK